MHFAVYNLTFDFIYLIVCKDSSDLIISLLGEYKGNPVTYAGGVGSMKDIEDLRKYGKDRLDITVGSALDLFGGNISFSELIKL